MLSSIKRGESAKNHIVNKIVEIKRIITVTLREERVKGKIKLIVYKRDPITRALSRHNNIKTRK